MHFVTQAVIFLLCLPKKAIIKRGSFRTTSSGMVILYKTAKKKTPPQKRKISNHGRVVSPPSVSAGRQASTVQLEGQQKGTWSKNTKEQNKNKGLIFCTHFTHTTVMFDPSVRSRPGATVSAFCRDPVPNARLGLASDGTRKATRNTLLSSYLVTRQRLKQSQRRY